MEREKTFLALSLGDPNRLWDLTVDKDSDVDKSVTAGTEEHSSFSEQAWDFYQVCFRLNLSRTLRWGRTLWGNLHKTAKQFSGVCEVPARSMA